MSLYYPIAQPTIAANILVRRERRLPVPGRVLVNAGQRVEPSEVIAETTLTAAPLSVDIATDLGVSPAAVSKRLRVNTGAQVERGQVLAQRSGIGTRVSRSPVAGIFTGYDPATGFGLITRPAEPVSVQAHLKGIVTDLIPHYGAVIETPATLVRWPGVNRSCRCSSMLSSACACSRVNPGRSRAARSKARRSS